MTMATTSKGYPYPVGTDRVADGDDAIKALAEAVNSDALITRATTVGHSLPAGVATAVQWNPASPNGCNLSKVSATHWAVTIAGIYVITAQAYTTGFQSVGTRNYMQLAVGATAGAWLSNRQSFAGENTTAPTIVAPLVVGDQIWFVVQPAAATNAAADTGNLVVARLGRT
jgi:hypothetical protein